jgi:hypothetical protein
MARWFRVYDDVVDDPKVQRLPLALFKLWVNTLCIASRNGGKLPTFEDMAFSLRVTEQGARDGVTALVQAGLLDREGDVIVPHNWSARQFKSDVSTERVRRFRNGDETFHETPPEQKQSKAETEPSSFHSDGAPAKPKRSKRGLPEEFPLQADFVWAEKLWLAKGRADLCSLMAEEAAKFRDYHASNATTSADWSASWRTWAKNAMKFNAHNGKTNGTGKPSAHENFAHGAILAAREFDAKQE